jgi:hypothetical protein
MPPILGITLRCDLSNLIENKNFYLIAAQLGFPIPGNL